MTRKRTGQSIIEAEGLTVSFDGFHALDHLNFSMLDDHLTVVIGPNGAGKTTLVDVITGRTRATAGHIRFDGRDISNASDYAIARAGLVRKFQAPSVFPDLTVVEHLRLAAVRRKRLLSALGGRIDDAVRAEMRVLIDTIGLAASADARAATLSHGQRQWLEIGMVLALRPRLLVLDEPIAGMTLDEIRRTARLLREINEHTAVLVIEHDMGFVRDIADRVCVFHQGRLLREGSFERVSNDPEVRRIYLGEEAA